MGYTPAAKSPAMVQKDSKSTTLIKRIKDYLPEIKNGLPKHITAQRMTRVIVTEVRKNPKLAECDTSSFFAAINQCVQLGLEPGTGLGHAYLLPYKNKGIMEVQLIVGYQGMIDLAERNGKVTIDAHVIYANDEFSYTLGLDPSITHIPCWNEDQGEVVGAYAVARYVDGRSKFRVMSKYEIDKARASSKSGKSEYSPWGTHYEEMARKTAIRRLFKLLPKSPEMAEVQELEDKDVIDLSEKEYDFTDREVDANDQKKGIEN